ncbi:MAG: hypothetical protein AAGF20_11985 [Pseudomonadota bacterium]
MHRLAVLSRPVSLAIILVLIISIAGAFGWVQHRLDGPMLDTLLTGDVARERLAALSDEQQHLHLITTLSLDSIFPFACSALLAGLIFRLAREWRQGLVIPALLAVPVDLLENGIQALALLEWIDLLGLKTVLTPLKFALFAAAALIALYLISRAIGERLGEEIFK